MSQTAVTASGLCIVSAVLVLSQQVVSEESDEAANYLEEEDYLSTIPVVTAGTRLKQKLTATPTAITILDRQTIAASGATEIAQLFRLVPGFLSYSVLGNQFGVTNRGLTLDFPGDLEVMLNGRSVYEPLFSAVEWSSLGITVDDIQSIEIARGSSAPAYGSNAFLGAINIVTVAPLQTSGLRVSSTAGDLQTRNADLRYSGSLGSAHYRMSLTYRHNEGFPAIDRSDPDRGLRIIDDNEALHFNIDSMFAPTLNDSVELRLSAGGSNIAIPDFGLSSQLDEHERKGYNIREFDSSYQHVVWKHSLGAGGETRLQLYHNRLEIDEELKLGLLSDVLAPLGVDIPALFDGHADEFVTIGLDAALSERYDLELQHSFNLNEQGQFVWGVATRFDRVRSKDLLDRDDAVSEVGYRLFANWEAQLGARVTTNAGLMLEHNDIVHTWFSPRVGVNFSLLPEHIIRLAATRGNRTPSVLEANEQQIIRFSDGVIIDSVAQRPDSINVAKLTEYELGYFGRFFGHRLSVDLRVFKTKVEDIASPVEVPAEGLDGESRQLTNALEWTSRGFDSQLRWQMEERTLLALQYAYTDFEGQRVDQFEPLEVRLLSREIPRHNVSILLSQRVASQWSASATWSYLSDVKWMQGDYVDQHQRLDLRLAYDFRLVGGSGQLELLGHNVFGDFIEYQDSNIFEPRWFLAVSFSLP